MRLFDGPGDMRARCREFNWARTSLGPVSEWPDALAFSVRMVMANGIPGLVLWGRELTQIYNDAYIGLIGAKHPAALGHGIHETWPELQQLNQPILDRVFVGETVTLVDAPYELERNGRIENATFTASFSPIVRDDTMTVGGILVTGIETTGQIQLRTLERERKGLIERLQTEQARLATVFRSAPSFLAVMRGPTHEFIEANDAFYQLVGHRPVIGQTVEVAFPEAAAQGFLDLLDGVMRTGEPFVGREMSVLIQRIPDAPMEQRYIDFVYQPYDENGERTGIVTHGYDVTEQVLARRQVERLLGDSLAARVHAEHERALATSVLENMNECYATLDAAFNFLSVNAAMERALGRSREELTGQSHWQAFPTSVGTIVEKHYRRAMEERTDVHFSHRYRGDGVDLVAEVDAYPTESGGLAVFWRDVTARVEASTALAESERRFRAVQDASPHGSTLYRPLRDESGAVIDFEFVYVNTAGATLAGYAPGLLTGRRLLDVFPHAVPNGVFERYVRAVEDRTTVEWEARDIREGIDLGVHFICVPVGDLLHVGYSDITPRMKEATEREELLATARLAYTEARVAESRLRDVFEQAPVSIAVLTGPEHVYTIASPRYVKSPGGGRPLLGIAVRDAFPEVASSSFPALMDWVYETGEPHYAFERSVQLDDNRDGVLVEHFLNIGYQALRDANGNVYAIASVVYDVTEQIHARQELESARRVAERAQADAEAANRAKGDFLAVMSHELRTPLNAIGGYTELIELGVHGPVTDAQRNALARIQVSQRHLLGLINGVLNYSRVEAGAVTYDLAPVPVHEAVTEAESLVVPQLRAKGLRYDWGGCDATLQVLADPEKLQQILLNLLSNAIKFTESRDGQSGCVAVSCSETEARVFIHVRDTGDGMDADKLRVVFDPFVQIDQRLTRKQEGVGLGLTISRELARGMGGNLTADSTVGAGSVFTVELPKV